MAPPKFLISKTVKALAEASGADRRNRLGIPIEVDQGLYDALAEAGTDMKDIAVEPPADD